AFTQTFCALSLPPTSRFACVPVVRVTVSPPLMLDTGMSEVADTTVVPVVAEVMTTVQLALGRVPRPLGSAAPPSYVHEGDPTKLPGPLTIDAVAVCRPGSIVPLRAFTVIVNVWFVPTALVAVWGVIWMLASRVLRSALPTVLAFTAVKRQSLLVVQVL